LRRRYYDPESHFQPEINADAAATMILLLFISALACTAATKSMKKCTETDPFYDILPTSSIT
jgi:hypothetical protein